MKVKAQANPTTHLPVKLCIVCSTLYLVKKGSISVVAGVGACRAESFLLIYVIPHTIAVLYAKNVSFASNDMMSITFTLTSTLVP